MLGVFNVRAKRAGSEGIIDSTYVAATTADQAVVTFKATYHRLELKLPEPEDQEFAGIWVDPTTKISFDIGTDDAPSELFIAEWQKRLEPENREESDPWILYTTNEELWDALVLEEQDEERDLYSVAVKRECPCEKRFGNQCPLCRGEGIVVRWLDTENTEDGGLEISAEAIDEAFSVLDSYSHLLAEGYQLKPEINEAV